MVDHRLREDDDLATILTISDLPPAAAGDVVYRLMDDGSYRVEVVSSTGDLVTVLGLTKREIDLLPRLSDANGVLAFDGQGISGLTAEQQAALDTQSQTLASLTASVADYASRLDALELGSEPELPQDFPDLALDQGAAATVINVAARSYGITGATWTVEGAGATITQSGVLTITTGALRDAAPITVTATRSGLSSSTTFTVTVTVPPVYATPVLPETLPAVILEADGVSYELDVGAVSTGVEDAVWSVAGLGASITQAGILTLAADAARATSPVTVTADVGPNRDSVTFPVTVVQKYAIELTRAATTAGLSGLTTANTLLDVKTAWTGQPVGVANNGAEVRNTDTFFSNGVPISDDAALLAAGAFSIRTAMTAAAGDETLELLVSTEPVDVLSAGGQATITGPGPVMLDPVIAGTPYVYQLSEIDPVVYTASNGSPGQIEATEIVSDGLPVPDADKLKYIEIGEKVYARNLVSAAGAETVYIAGEERTAIPSTIYVKAGTEDTVQEVVSGLTEAQAIARVILAPSTASSGRLVELASLTVLQNGQPLNGGLTVTGATLTFTIERKSLSAPNLTTTVESVVNAAQEVTPAIPDVGPYTLAHTELLRTDGATRGVTIGRTLKKVGVDTLPDGMTRSGITITVASGADIPLVENWDFSEHQLVIRGRVRLFSNCKFAFASELALCLIDMYAGSRVDRWFRCSFLGAGYFGGATGKSCIRPRIGNPILSSPIIDLMERCDFFGWGGDVIKSIRGGIIRLCYFDTAINLPLGTAKWSATKAYKIGDWVTSADGKYAYTAAVAGTNLALPSAKTSNANWQNQDPHSDTINPYFQFDPSLTIDACYINRLEGIRAVDPGKPRAVGINNGIRATRDSGTDPLNEVRITNTIITKSDINEAYPLQLQDLVDVNTQPAVLIDNKIGTQSGGEIAHPNGRTGHTITNVVDYANPTTPSAGYGEIGTPGTGTGGGGTGPDPTPEPEIDLTTPAILFSIGQSELAKLTGTYQYLSRPARPTAPNLDAENFVMYHYNDAFAAAGSPIKTVATQANRKQMSDSMIVLANALNHSVPGKQFVFAVAHESGSSRVSLSSDGGYPSASNNRLWGPTQAIVDAVLADYPQGFDRGMEFWYAADQALQSQWLRDFAPFYFKQTEGGAPVAFGSTPTTTRNQTLDHAIFDFNSTGKGQGLFDKMPWDIIKKAPWSSDTLSRRAGVQRFADDPRYQSLGGVFGHSAASWTTDDGSHPHATEFYGYRQATFEFFMPSMLRAAGIPIRPVKFIGVFTAPDGSYADAEFLLPNGGVLSTNAEVRNEPPAPDSIVKQDIFGFEILRASGGGKYPICKVGAVGIDPKYQGTVRKVNGKARITMVQPLQNGDKISFMWGRGDPDTPNGQFYRTDYPNVGKYTGEMYRFIPLEHVAKYTDPNSEFPFPGFQADSFSPEWTVARGAYVGDSNPATVVVTPTPETPPAAATFGQEIQTITVSKDGAANATTSHAGALPSAPSAGNLIVAEFAVDKAAGAIGLPSGFTAARPAVSTTGVSGVMAYKIATGSEGTLTFTTGTAQISSLRLSEIKGPFAASPLGVTASVTTGTSSTSVALSAGNASQNDLYAHATYYNDSRTSIGGTPAATNGFTVTTNPLLGGSFFPGVISARKIITAADNPTTAGVSTTISHGGTADESIGFLAVFKSATGPQPEPEPTTNTPFTMSGTGPVLTDPSDVPAGTTRIRHAFKFRVPSAVANTTSPRYLAVQRDGGFNLRLIVVSGGVSLVVEKIEDSTGAEAHPYSTRWSGGARNTWYEVDMAADLENRTLTMTVNGAAQSNTQFYAAGATTTFQSIRGMNWFALDPAGASALHAGVEIEYFDTYFKTNGVETLRKHITGPAATVNADPWKSGGNAT